MTSLINPPSATSSQLEALESVATTNQQTVPLADVPSQLDSAPIEKPTLKCELQIFASTFLTIFLAELGDKTQLTTLLMTAESHSPWVVFAGAGAALVLTSLLGILLGRWLSTKIAPKTLEVSAGVLLLVIAAMLCCDIFWS